MISHVNPLASWISKARKLPREASWQALSGRQIVIWRTYSTTGVAVIGEDGPMISRPGPLVRLAPGSALPLYAPAGVLLTHFWPGNDRERSCAAAAASFAGEIHIAEEGVVIPLR
jgi:hypothetical protein